MLRCHMPELTGTGAEVGGSGTSGELPPLLLGIRTAPFGGSRGRDSAADGGRDVRNTLPGLVSLGSISSKKETQWKLRFHPLMPLDSVIVKFVPGSDERVSKSLWILSHFFMAAY